MHGFDYPILCLQIGYLKFKSGDNLKHIIRNIMKELFTDDCLQHFSWTGTHGTKEVFETLNLKNIIFGKLCSTFL